VLASRSDVPKKHGRSVAVSSTSFSARLEAASEEPVA
jgi:hypothetical protein